MRLAEMCGGIGAVCFSSGMAALGTTFLALTKAGSNIVSSTSLFVGTVSLFNRSLAKYGVETRYFVTGEEDTVDDLIDENTVALFTELVGNPRMDFADIERLSAIAEKA